MTMESKPNARKGAENSLETRTGPVGKQPQTSTSESSNPTPWLEEEDDLPDGSGIIIEGGVEPPQKPSST